MPILAVALCRDDVKLRAMGDYWIPRRGGPVAPNPQGRIFSTTIARGGHAQQAIADRHQNRSSENLFEILKPKVN